MRARWTLIRTIRLILRNLPFAAVKRAVEAHILIPLLPADAATFDAHLPGGGLIELRYRETVGTTFFLHGDFERAEIDFLRARAVTGTAAIDVGANVGVYTISLAQAVGPTGRVLAIEPAPLTAARLRTNLARNKIVWADVLEIALDENDASATFHVDDDPAYSRLVDASGSSSATLTVPVRRLDTIWQESGWPRVSVVKIDVEGGEFAVLRGGASLLTSMKPVLLLETRRDLIDAITAWLNDFSYLRLQPRGFLPWNFAFVPIGATLSEGGA